RIIDSLPESPVRADALIATVPGIFPAVKTADCLPILILDPTRKISAAVHAGWRGTVLRITQKVLQILVTELHMDPADLKVALGPAIGPCCYEVDDAVLIPFRKAIPEADRFIQVVSSTEGSALNRIESRRLDLVAANRSELTGFGVPKENIVSIEICTSCHPDLFFSYRRDGSPSGRHLAVTGFKCSTT
ncbi:MAG: peptidoglycan editing factor PgeF, partial [Deltaproteobacteria bacterium]|nr:peptidoglycan editing factor PgeF [Deltaproteobacteria bacterium]